MLKELVDTLLVAAFIRNLQVVLGRAEEHIKKDVGCDSLKLAGSYGTTTDGQCVFELDLQILRYRTWRKIETFHLTYGEWPMFADLEDGFTDLLNKVTKVARRNRFRTDGAE